MYQVFKLCARVYYLLNMCHKCKIVHFVGYVGLSLPPTHNRRRMFQCLFSDSWGSDLTACLQAHNFHQLLNSSALLPFCLFVSYPKYPQKKVTLLCSPFLWHSRRDVSRDQQALICLFLSTFICTCCVCFSQECAIVFKVLQTKLTCFFFPSEHYLVVIKISCDNGCKLKSLGKCLT